jgi:hypothetical protein
MLLLLLQASDLADLMGSNMTNHSQTSHIRCCCYCPLLPQESDLADHIRCVRLAGLSTAQQQQIADGYAVFGRLLEPVLQGMRQLQLQQPTEGCSSVAGASCERNSSSSNMGVAIGGNGRAAEGGAGGSKQLGQQAAAAAVSGGASALLTAENYKTHRSVHFMAVFASASAILLLCAMIVLLSCR